MRKKTWRNRKKRRNPNWSAGVAEEDKNRLQNAEWPDFPPMIV
jgi:hypothetical protein